MILSNRPQSATVRRWASVCMAAGAVLLSAGCASVYVDTATKEIAAQQYRKPAQAQPAQLLFEFQTKGVTNARATEALKAQVAEQVRSSGLFSEVGDKPVAGGALLSVTLNNVPLTDNAFAKGFATGLTFGLAGTQVSDGYVCTVNYLAPDQAQPLVKTARHAIHTTMGASSAPANGVKAESIDAAVRTMTRQVASSAFNDLSQDDRFR